MRARKRDIQEIANKYIPNFVIGCPCSNKYISPLRVTYCSPEIKQRVVDEMYRAETSDIALINKFENRLITAIVQDCIDRNVFSDSDKIWLYDAKRKEVIGDFWPSKELFSELTGNIRILLPVFGTSTEEQQRYKEYCSINAYFAEYMNELEDNIDI